MTIERHDFSCVGQSLYNVHAEIDHLEIESPPNGSLTLLVVHSLSFGPTRVSIGCQKLIPVPSSLPPLGRVL